MSGNEYVDPSVYVCLQEESENDVHYNDNSNILTFIAEEANSTIKLNRAGTDTALQNAVLKYSTNNGGLYQDYVIGDTITLQNVGDSVKFKGNNATLGTDSSNYHQFVMTGKIKSSGDITSLFNEVGGNIAMPAYGCYELFRDCASLTVAPVLPATTLADNCYGAMFRGCTSLTTAPALPAMTLAASCYVSMFNRCTALKTPPALPAKALTSYCYQFMFYGCTSLETAPKLPAETLADGCYFCMFQNCTNLTTVQNQIGSQSTLIPTSACSNMFKNTSILSAPELPSMLIRNASYAHMFEDCKKLESAPSVLPATDLYYWCYQNMFRNCTKLKTTPQINGQVPKNGAQQFVKMFENCSSLETATILQTGSTGNGMYQAMFNGCSSLKYIKALFTVITSNGLKDWTIGVPTGETGTFVMNSNANWNPEDHRGQNGIPVGWTVQTASE